MGCKGSEAVKAMGASPCLGPRWPGYPSCPCCRATAGWFDGLRVAVAVMFDPSEQYSQGPAAAPSHTLHGQYLGMVLWPVFVGVFTALVYSRQRQSMIASGHVAGPLP